MKFRVSVSNLISNPWSVALLLGATATASWAAPLGGASAVHPIVDLDSGYILGGSKAGSWLKPDVVARSLQGGESYRVYGARGLLGRARGTKPKSEGAPCEDTLFLKMTPRSKAGEFAVSGGWNAVSRAPRVMSNTQPAYINAVAALIKRNGIARPKVKIEQVWRVDLEGDGQDEVLISATNHAGANGDYTQGGSISPRSLAGEYSLAILRKVVGGQAKTIVLGASYYPKTKTFNAPNIVKLGAVLDANGDGKMEVILRGAYYEGNWTSVHEIRGDKAVEVLVEGCGA